MHARTLEARDGASVHVHWIKINTGLPTRRRIEFDVIFTNASFILSGGEEFIPVPIIRVPYFELSKLNLPTPDLLVTVKSTSISSFIFNDR